MIQALLAAVIVCCLLCGRVSTAVLATAGAVSFVVLWLGLRHGHSHTHWTAIDYYAQQSRLHRVSAGLKALLALALIVLVLSAGSPAVSAFTVALTFFLTVAVGRTPFLALLRLYATPLTFVLLSGLALLFDVTPAAAGVLSLPLFGRYLSVTAETQALALRIMLGAAASVSCLYALCLSTPLYALIAALGRAHVPELLIELMYLIYRYIFVLSATLSQMKTAAASRLGYVGFSAAMRSTGRIMTSLLVASFQKASVSFDAMQSRCYEGRLRFLEERNPLKFSHIAGAAAVLAAVACAIILERVWF